MSSRGGSGGGPGPGGGGSSHGNRRNLNHPTHNQSIIPQSNTSHVDDESGSQVC